MGNLPGRLSDCIEFVYVFEHDKEELVAHLRHQKRRAFQIQLTSGYR
jgi:hypothetical protein